MAYHVELETRVVRELRDLPRADQQRVRTKVDSLAEDPRPAGCEKLAGAHSAWRVRTGNYRIIYTVDDPLQVVTVTRIGHRRDVYRRM